MWAILGKVLVSYVVIKFIWSVLTGIYTSFLGSSINIKTLGKWAVVTGATDGIGKAYSFELAKRGMNVVLISRSLSKLQDVATEIRTKYNVEVKIIAVDFTHWDIYEKLRNELAGLEVGVLVNNVGMSYEHPEYFHHLTDEKVEQIITCNMVSVTNMTKILIKGMVERRKGLILNVSSLSSLIPAPLLAVYGATKAYVVSFSRSLELETRSTGVKVLCVAPGFVVSKLSKIRRSSLMVPTAESYAKHSLCSVGKEIVTGGYFMHKLQIYGMEIVQKFLPDALLNSIVFSQLSALRASAIRKKQRESKSQ